MILILELFELKNFSSRDFFLLCSSDQIVKKSIFSTGEMRQLLDKSQRNWNDFGYKFNSQRDTVIELV